MNPFLNRERRLRNGWWIAIFFALLASMLIPLLVMTQRDGSVVSPGTQAVLVLVVSCICQWLRRRPIAELAGAFDRMWPTQLLIGVSIGALLMLVPALFLRVIGRVTWQWSGGGWAIPAAALVPCIAVVVAEELLFRGFIFQRLIDGAGPWIAQLLLAGYFVLTHSAGLSTAGDQKVLASVNIFIASLLFGLAFLRTRSLAMPLGIHFGANFTQGPILGFGVSGNSDAGLLQPLFNKGSDWLTGGAFGIEASVPGLLCVIAATFLFHRWRPTRDRFWRDSKFVQEDE